MLAVCNMNRQLFNEVRFVFFRYRSSRPVGDRLQQQHFSTMFYVFEVLQILELVQNVLLYQFKFVRKLPTRNFPKKTVDGCCGNHFLEGNYLNNVPFVTQFFLHSVAMCVTQKRYQMISEYTREFVFHSLFCLPL